MQFILSIDKLRFKALKPDKMTERNMIVLEFESVHLN